MALSIKLDSLLALFSVGKIPTGSKDPFALRRACNGVLRICLHYNLPFNLQADLQTLSAHYAPFDLSLLREFMLERLSHVLNAKSPNLYKSVLKGIEALGGQDYEICQMANKLYALQDFLDQVEDSKQLVSVFKRVANITQDTQHASNPDPCLFQDTSEQGLYEAYLNLQKSTFPQWGDKIHALFALKAPLELFFEKVLINDSNPQIQNNRKSLLFLICREFLSVADIKEL
ncbi:glycyl-tRNA synthetase beta chain [Helicobacter bizzozeronii CIII-1]|uniref:glycine--tRNA ligase n=1 Tax=Helicobacter bizzozeronii (strain CIII-1) TaxID=1002804 RepID=F8KTT1_HELBC|nr:glycyl-tRNA synthetase beta chain [Helicobacter bizzozeronii CIII-1]